MPVQPLSPPRALDGAVDAVEAVASAAADRLRAETNESPQEVTAALQALIAATSSAMSAGASLAEIAAAEQAGLARVRQELGKDLLRTVERAHKRRTDIERDWEQAIRRAGRLGLVHRDIAEAAGVAPATIRTILTGPANDADAAAAKDHTSEDAQNGD